MRASALLSNCRPDQASLHEENKVPRLTTDSVTREHIGFIRALYHMASAGARSSTFSEEHRRQCAKEAKLFNDILALLECITGD